MDEKRSACLAVLFLVANTLCMADFRYVSTNGGCNSPYTTWTDAATNLALAITAATSGDTIIISNGTYRTLSATSVNKSLIITSLYGAAQTVFDGNGQLFHCLRVVSGPLISTVYGITITNYFNSAINLTAGSNSVLSLVDCVFRGNQYHAGGALYIYSGRLQATNCVFKGNRATHNVFAGGVSRPWCDNSIIYYNTSGDGVNSNFWNADTVVRPWTNCCTAPDLATLTIGGTNCITDPAGFDNAYPGAFQLASDSPCINAGTNEDWMVGAKDMAGRPRLDFFDRQVDIGAYEYVSKGTLFLFMGQ